MTENTREYSRKELISANDAIDFREHTANSRAKRVIEVAPCFPKVAGRNKAPVTKTVAGADGFDLELNKAYRLVSSIAIHFLLADVTGVVPTTSDIYLPANQPVIIRSDENWKRLEVIPNAGSGLVQITEVS